MNLPQNRLLRIRCFPSRFQEPYCSEFRLPYSYVMMRYNEKTLLFDERFINYGCNKVQYVDHLRYKGYAFYIPGDVFSVDLVHKEWDWIRMVNDSSSFRNRFMNSYGGKNLPVMTLVCYYYLDAVQKEYSRSKHVLPLCHYVNSVTYKVIKG